MTLFDLFSKRRKFLPLYEKVWSAIEPYLMIKAGPEDEIAHRLDCFYYASTVYSILYQTAVAAGMSSSSAFSMTRIQLSKYPFDASLRHAVDVLFSADAGEKERTYADRLQATISQIVVAIKTGQDAVAAGVGDKMTGLEQFFAAQDFAAAGLYPPRQDA